MLAFTINIRYSPKMNGSANLNRIINSNDNFRYSWVNDPEYKNATSHIPLANWLIQKYCTKWWKNHPDNPDYQRLQFNICFDLSLTWGSREWTLTYVAMPLGIDALILINDPSPELQNIR